MEENNNEEKQIQQVQPVVDKKKGNKGLIVLLIIIILGLVCYIAYDKLAVDNNSKVETTETDNKNEKEEKEEETKKPEEHIKPTLFDKEVFIEDVCPDYKCEKDLGTFMVGNESHNASIYINGRKGYEDFEGYIKFDDVKIKDPSPYDGRLHKIVKIGQDYIGIGRSEGPNIGYAIDIYDKDLKLVKTFSSIVQTNRITENFIDYFTAEANGFTRYTCDTSKDTGDTTNQYLVKHMVTITDGKFEEKEISRVKEYCSAQS